MERFNFSDFVHYDRNDPAELQSIFFDTDPEFNKKFSKVFMAYVKKADQNPDMLMVDYLVGLQKEIERKLGPLTLSQMLLVTHVIASRMGFESGFEKGYEKACDEITRSYMGDVFGTEAKNNKGSLLN